jgi:hypothetical protein
MRDHTYCEIPPVTPNHGTTDQLSTLWAIKFFISRNHTGGEH